MSDPAYVIDIDRLVLTGITERTADRMRSPIEVEIGRVLSGAALPQALAAPSLRDGIAGEVARSVGEAVRGSER